MITTRTLRSAGAALLAAPLAALLLSCSSGPDEARAGAPASAPASATSSATASASPSVPVTATEAYEEPVEKVRDAFATLQATYNDGCTTPGECEYFLTRVHDELDGLDAAMKADPQGRGHFREPLAWTAELRGTLHGDVTFENLKKHQDLLVGTRDRINRWMQGHPEDYR
ncbi:hypothetical protein ACFWVC_09125 [Streptomyces sp. NPDC058691]|uniref:hypothetical protein n=1 Tax=Streptomyces sp. NPDC058691 TaxID=3346601 RepID=UPI0036469602